MRLEPRPGTRLFIYDGMGYSGRRLFEYDEATRVTWRVKIRDMMRMHRSYYSLSSMTGASDRFTEVLPVYMRVQEGL